MGAWRWVPWDPTRKSGRGRDAEVVVVDETLKRFLVILHRAHFDSATHAVEGHGDDGIAGFPADGAVFGIVGYRPNAGLGLDEGLVSVSVILWREVVDGGILVEVVGGVGFAFGDGTVSDIIVGIRSVIRGDQLIADVVAVLLVVLRATTIEKNTCLLHKNAYAPPNGAVFHTFIKFSKPRWHLCLP